MIRLSGISTKAHHSWKREEIERLTEKYAKRIGQLQRTMNAEKKHSLLVIMQGMDGSGKDGAIKNVFDFCTPIGMQVYAFKKPTEEEFAHDFLWRVHKQVPQKGMFVVFNRSHYEDILIQRVHKWIDEDRVAKRMKAINAFEACLVNDANTVVLKFYMHISREQQLIQLQERIDDPDKQWKHNPNDWKESERWDEYMRCYEYAINESVIPWTIVPVDQRWVRDYVISKTIVEALEKLDMKLPTLAQLG
jgi:PPK2 family polyphosphate:nucleotide phosphotransferase